MICLANQKTLSRFRNVALFFIATVPLVSRAAFAQLRFEASPINYNTSPVANRVSQLQQRISAGDAKLDFDDKNGYLRSVLAHLDVPVSSQMLVFSKTSFQQRKISPSRPRAVYFNDDVYVGWVQGSDVVELSVADPRQGAIFYTLRQEKDKTPQFMRDRGQCLTCHASSRTAGVPGHLIRSVYSSRTGLPHFGSGTFTTDHQSPFRKRWGGWYVTGTHGQQRHMGNVVVTDPDRREQLDTERGANVVDLKEFTNVTPYLAATSDIVALMVLGHQAQMHNLITRAGFETRSALHHDDIMNRALERTHDFQSDTTQRRIKSVGDKLVDYMLFVEECPLVDAVRGTSGFAEEFAARGPFDSRGRSLRQLDLNQRLMTYPCSYLIYSEAFEELPDTVKELVFRRLFSILTGTNDDVDRFEHLSTGDRVAILEILRETKNDLPDYWLSGK